MSQQGKYRFQYREFYDVPRVILIPTDLFVLKLESLFSEIDDDYTDNYTISITREVIHDFTDYWIGDSGAKWTTIGHIPIRDVKFDATKRSYLSATFLDRLLLSAGFPFASE